MVNGDTSEVGAAGAFVFQVLPAEEGQCVPSWVMAFEGSLHGFTVFPVRPDEDGAVLELLTSTGEPISYHIGAGSQDVVGATVQITKTDDLWLLHFTEGTTCQHDANGFTDRANCGDTGVAELALSPAAEVDGLQITTSEAVLVERSGELAAQNLCTWTPNDNVVDTGLATTVP